MLRALLPLLLLPALAGDLFAQYQPDPASPSPRAARAHFTDTPPRIDGVLDDPIWQQIDPISDFRQREPVEGAPSTERTEVRIAFDEHNLYFGLTLFDNEPEKIRANIFDRGGRIDKDDNIRIALDTYHDRRNAYIFEMNPLGTQDDALITDEKITMSDWNWDGVYYSEGRITEAGWVLEVAIPFTTIRFSKDEAPEMGVAILRTINRKNEQVIWPFIGLDYRWGVFQVSQYATLSGLRDLKRGHYLQIKPYLLTGAQTFREAEAPSTDLVRDLGVDVKYGITSNLTLDLTYNTDFAQVEADNVQINLTRFNLFYPEKREFFLERAGLFEFGNSEETETFFSRRIGITNDILAGARMTGQAGPVSIGLLNIQTKQEAGRPGANYGVARVRTDLSERSSVGAIFTNLEGPGGHYNRAAGVDGSLRFWGSSGLSAWVTQVWDAEAGASDAAGSIDLTLRNDRYNMTMGYTNIGRRFSPGIGFVRRQDMLRYSASAGFTPRLRRTDTPLRRFAFNVAGDYIEGHDHVLQTTSVEAYALAYLVQRDHGGFTFERTFERLPEPFFIRPDVAIPAGDYTFSTAGVLASSDESRRFFGKVEAEAGTFFDGTTRSVGGAVGVRVSKHLKLQGLFNRTSVALPRDGGDFTASVIGLDFQAATSRQLFAKGLIQYDNFSRDLQANIRIDWIHTPGSDLFLVFNTSYSFDDNPFSFYERNLRHRAGVAKLTYLVTL